MIADKERALHGSGGNHAGLHHRAGNQEKRERHPNPGEQFANQALAEGVGFNGRRTRSAGGGQLGAGGKIGSRVRAYRAGGGEIIVHGTFLIRGLIQGLTLGPSLWPSLGPSASRTVTRWRLPAGTPTSSCPFSVT